MSGRLTYLDNLKVALTVLVVLHHSSIMYSGTGGFYYHEGLQDQLTVMVIGTFCAVNQAYFMALFFMISAYFTPASLEKKGTAGFIRDRLIRLGVPLVCFDIVLHPLIVSFCEVNLKGSDYTFAQIYRHCFTHPGGIGRGPLWFVETLLIFSMLYVAVTALGKASPVRGSRPLPGFSAMAVFAVALGLTGFLVRTLFPIGYSFGPLNLQFSFFPLYVALFFVGTVAYRNDWFSAIQGRAGRAGLAVSACAIVALPVIAILGGAFSGKLDLFMGGWHAESLVNSLWESTLCVSMCIGLLWLFRTRFNSSGRILEAMSGSAYFVYIIHPIVLVTVAFLLKGWHAHPIVKFACNGAISVTVCFTVCHLTLRLIPSLKRVL